MKAVALLVLGLVACAIAAPIEGPKRVSTNDILDLEQQLKQQAGEDKHVDPVPKEKPTWPKGITDSDEEEDVEEEAVEQPDQEESELESAVNEASKEEPEDEEEQHADENELESAAQQQNTQYEAPGDDEAEEYDEVIPRDYDMRDAFLRALRNQALAYPPYEPESYDSEYQDAYAARLAELEAAQGRNNMDGSEYSNSVDSDDYESKDSDNEMPKRFHLEDLQHYGGDVEAKVVAKKSGYGAPKEYLQWLEAQNAWGEPEQEDENEEGQNGETSGDDEEANDTEEEDFNHYLNSKSTPSKRQAELQHMIM
jgi:hypothetical protein